MSDNVNKNQGEASDIALDVPKPKPLTHYRRTDAVRKQHVDSMQDEVFEKVSAVIDSFREKPAKGERSHDPERVIRKIRRHSVDVSVRSPMNWLFLALICSGFMLMIAGWIRLF